VLSAHVFVAYSNNSIACGCQKLGACTVIGLLSFSVVPISLELDDDAFAGTVEVNDETVQDVLPAKLQAEYAPIAQQGPRMAFGGVGRWRSAWAIRLQGRIRVMNAGGIR
jgi:hypothetical protein